MIVCICKRINEDKVNEALSQGKSVKAIMSELEIGKQCGKCLPTLIEIVRKDAGVR